MKLPGIIERELETCPFKWSVEPGAKHHKILVSGVFAGILPHTLAAPDRRGALNVRAQIRRVVKQLAASK